MLANGAFDTRELNRVAYQDGNRHIVTLCRDGIALKFDKHIALVNNVAHLGVHGKVLTLELNGIESNVDEHVQAIDRVKRNGMTRGKNRFDLGVRVVNC